MCSNVFLKSGLCIINNDKPGLEASRLGMGQSFVAEAYSEW